MTRNPVAANLLMVILMLGGILVGSKVKQEVFPEFDLDLILIAVPYPGATPTEVEQGVVLPIEEAIEGIDGVKKVRSTAQEGGGTVTAELMLNSDPQKALSDIKNAVDRIVTFPQDAERPTVQLGSRRKDVISMLIYGDSDHRTLRTLAEQVRDDLLSFEEITEISIANIPPVEISVEIGQETLRAHGLTLAMIAETISGNSLDLPGGAVKTRNGEILIRTTERRELGREFEEIEILSLTDGSKLRLGDIAHVKDGYAEFDAEATYNGKPAIEVRVYRVGDQTPIEIANIVKKYVDTADESLPDGVNIAVWSDQSKIYRDRIDLLLRNAGIGLILVMLILGLFMEIRLAFWVTMGIPISFLGSLFLMPAMDVSINMISLFAFIVTLGMVVDDAIVVGESAFHLRRQGVDKLEAAIGGVKKVARPVTFAILTTIVAFMPMFFVPGVSGKLFRVIPAIVVSVLLISWVESLFILPAHLAHLKDPKTTGFAGWFNRKHRAIGNGFEWCIEHLYGPVLRMALKWRMTTITLSLGMLIAGMTYWGSGRVDFTFMPKVEYDRVTARVALPFGESIEETRQARNRLLTAAQEILDEHDEKNIHIGILSQIGYERATGGPGAGAPAYLGAHLATIEIRFVGSSERKLTMREFTRMWREKTGALAGVDTLTFHYSSSASAGAAIDIQLTHPDIDTLESAAQQVTEELAKFNGVTDIEDGFEAGKRQTNFVLTEEGRSAGLSAKSLGRQLRNSFFGAEAIRQQRGRDELRVYVRLPRAERESPHTLENFIVKTPEGNEMPLSMAANQVQNRSYTSIRRVAGQRVINVTADVESGVANAPKVLAELERNSMQAVLERHPGLTYSLEGESSASNESLESLGIGYIFALLMIFGLLAIPFKSYLQPIVVMSAIPFGIVGALIGHVLMGFDMSIISLMGIVALSGVVVNDSLVLVDAANNFQAEGMSVRKAIESAGKRRCRPIVLTSLTTFLGLAPMIFETSVQARFLIPMAISLGFGILYATVIILLFVPTVYTLIEDFRSFFRVPVEEENANEAGQA